MGYCLKPQSSKKRAYDNAESDDDEDWSWAMASLVAERGTEGGYSTKNTDDFSGKITVKIKISKKQLEKLLSKMEVKDLRVDQVMSQLMSHRDRHGYEMYQHQ